MNRFYLRIICAVFFTGMSAIGVIFTFSYLQERALHTLPHGFTKFSLSDPLPACARWKEHMPAYRDPVAYRLYIEARKVWRSKIEWQLTKEEATRILNDVQKAADLGDWGARALMAHFYLEGLGPLESNKVLVPDLYKAVAIARMAADAGQPWGLYDLGVAYEYGYGGAHYDEQLAWAYYLKAAQLGSPEAQMALASAYVHEGRLDDQEIMIQCAYRQRFGPAAFALGVDRQVSANFKESINYFYEGVKFGDKDCASALHQLFNSGYWNTTSAEEKPALKLLGIHPEWERSNRFETAYEALQINPDLKLSRLDHLIPMPPVQLPPWIGIDAAVEPESTDPPTY